MFKKIARVLGGDPDKKKTEELIVITNQVNSLEAQFETLSEDALHAKTAEFRKRLQNGETLDDLLPEAFAAVREASKRVLGQRHYDVQLICGITLHHGEIAEMRTGEGKTLAATMPLYLNALTSKGAHLVTVNDYLARRDGRWMGAIYHLLDMTVGVLQMAARTDNCRLAFIYDPAENSLHEEQHQMRPVLRPEAYKADITYGTNNEFGFDFLRDNITMSLDRRVQRGHHYAIIDEVDNILIDEARTPLIISGPAHEDSETYLRMAQVVRALAPEDYEVSEKDKTVTLTEIGLAHVEELLGMPLRDPDRPEDITLEQARLLGFLEQGLRAQFLFRRNKEYLVQKGNVVIVDEFTGRLMPGRRWSDGLHQAMEAKEGVKVQAENITHATITIQNYFRMYEKLAGMTGTAITEAEEFFDIYRLEVLAIPTNLDYIAMQPETDLKAVEARDQDGYKYTYYAHPDDAEKTPVFWQRKDYPDVVFRSEEGKLRAIVREIIQYHVLGRPQLVGTTSVENSDRLSERLSPQSVRRLLQTLILRQAWFEHNNVREGEVVSTPELNTLNEPLDKLRMPELRRLGHDFGITSLNPADPSNHAPLLTILGLNPEHLQRLLPLMDAGVPHKVLNARKHTEESQIIASAGAFGAVTIATNMAGRGVDIKLGGELPEETLSQINHILAKAGYEDPYNIRMDERLAAMQTVPKEKYPYQEEEVQAFLKYMAEMERVRELGGLHVVGSERHDARRIDNQLRGRAARQGDPGSSRFYLSLEDELMRLFGGEQVQSVLSRMKIDETLPIESGLVGKLIEQSQTRVEGANFDVRKHLLEYDDVLNDQRERIYSQRNRIFTKQDLREDVTEMLRTELGNRIQSALDDKEGPWKLLAYLDDIQPPLSFSWLSYPSYSLKLVMDHIGDPQNEADLQQKLLTLAEQTVHAENEHLMLNVQSLLSRSEMSLESQLAERYDTLDTFLDAIQYDESAVKRDVTAELSNLLHIPLRLSNSQLKTLAEDPYELQDEIREQVRTTLTQIMVRRLILTFERRLNQKWSLKASDLMTQTWDEINQTLLAQVDSSISRRAERFLGEKGEIARDLNANQERISAALHDKGELMRLLMLMTQGTVLTFDAKSRRKQFKVTRRISYIFLLASWLESKTDQEIIPDVLAHLEVAEEKFCQVFGHAEWNHLLNTGANLTALSEPKRNELIELLGEEAFTDIQDQKLQVVDPALKAQVITFLGGQAQNRVYRRLLLSTISELWVEYLTRMEALRVSIRMEAYGQRDPLVQYKNQASTMFKELLSDIRAGVISRMFRYRPTQAADAQIALRVVPSGAASPAQASGKKAAKDKPKRKKRKRH